MIRLLSLSAEPGKTVNEHPQVKDGCIGGGDDIARRNTDCCNMKKEEGRKEGRRQRGSEERRGEESEEGLRRSLDVLTVLLLSLSKLERRS